MKTKTFDCVAMKRAAQTRIRAAVRGMDRKAEIEYFRAGAGEFERRVEESKESRPPVRKPTATGGPPRAKDS